MITTFAPLTHAMAQEAACIRLLYATTVMSALLIHAFLFSGATPSRAVLTEMSVQLIRVTDKAIATTYQWYAMTDLPAPMIIVLLVTAIATALARIILNVHLTPATAQVIACTPRL